jgi:hypothetical protein
MKVRGKFQGMITIARFNWPFYLAALAMFVAAGSVIFLTSGPLRAASAVAFGCAAYFIFVSLGVSHFVYDCSDLYRWSWLGRATHGAPVRQAIFCHSGFDETSPELRERFSEVQWTILDHYDPERMTEPSIHRARSSFPPTPGTLACRYNAWPLPANSADVVFGLLAIHELRTEAERSAWFAEARRCLRQGGRIVLAEHVRDAANFLAYGPGFLHFHSLASWNRCRENAGLRSLDQFRITPFVQILVLSAP